MLRDGHFKTCPAVVWADGRCTCAATYADVTEGLDFDGPGSMTVTVTFAGGEKQTFDNVLVPTQGEPFSYHDGGSRVQFESADLRNPTLYTVLNPLSIATFTE